MLRDEQQFAVGEIAIWCRPGSPNFGKEVTVIGPLRLATTLDAWSGEISTGLRYQIEHSPGWVLGPHERLVKKFAPPEHLRKRWPPPQREATSSWDDVIVWRPNTTKAGVS